MISHGDTFLTPKQKTKASKYLSYLLRHNAELIDNNGWASVNDVIRGMHEHGYPVTHTILKEIVADDEKQRYSFDGDKIRANQGHSLVVDLGLVAIAPPEFLYHGTANGTLRLIYRDGLLPQSRQYVHLSEDIDTAHKVGKRHGEPVVITIQAAVMAGDGYAFYRSENGVWLTKAVPLIYLTFGFALP